MIQKTILNNGLTIITNNIETKTTTLSYTVKCGSYNEDESNLGIAHFTEHMLFKGTTTRTSKDISEAIETIGGYLNASTSFERTNYYCTIPADYWEIGIDVLSDMIWNNLIPEEEFIKEKQVILEELKMYNDDAGSKIWDLLFTQLHPSYINRQLVGGTLESVSKTTREQMIRFIDKFYIPSNIIISSVGNIDHKKLVDFIKNFTSGIELSKTEDIINENFVPDKLTAEDLIVKKDISQSHLAWGMFGPKNAEEIIVGEVLCSLVGGGTCSRLYQIIREDKGLAYSVYMGLDELRDESAITGYVGLDGTNIKLVKEIVLEELNKLKTEVVTETELKRTKAYLKGTLLIHFEKTSSQNSFIINAYLNDMSLDIEDYFKIIDKVTAKDIKNFANKFFKEDNLTFVQIVPNN